FCDIISALLIFSGGELFKDIILNIVRRRFKFLCSKSKGIPSVNILAYISSAVYTLPLVFEDPPGPLELNFVAVLGFDMYFARISMTSFVRYSLSKGSRAILT